MKLFLLASLLLTVLWGKSQGKLPLTLESIWNGYFDEKNLLPHVLNTKPAVAFIRADKATNFEGILTLDMITGKIIDTIFTNQTKVEENGTPTTFAFFEDFELSPNDESILIKTERQGIYHNSFKEFVYIWNDVKKTLKPVSTDGKISHATFNPKGNLLAYIRDGNIYIRNLDTDKTSTVTTDGAAGSIINGMADEVYEDGFGIGKLLEWNPNGDKLAFAKINQAFVKKIPLSVYEKNDPIIKPMVYAKPGEAISEIGIFVYDIKNNAFSKLELGSNSNQYILNFKWQQDAAAILVEKLTRNQKKLEIIKCNAINGSFIKTILTEEKPDYVKVNKVNMLMHPTKNTFFWLTEKDGYNHIYNVHYDNDSITQITKGEWEVNQIESYDVQNDKLYFTANIFWNTQNNLFAINTDGQQLKKISANQGWHNVWFSKDNQYYFDRVSTINTPSIYKIYKATGREITNTAIIENKRFKENTKNFDINETSFFTLKNKNNITLNGWIINGDSTNKSTEKKPLLLYIYGGNNRQEVTDEWKDRETMTFKYLANKGYTVACIDPSGTPGLGEKLRKQTYNALTTNAIDDIIAAKDYLLKTYKLDPKNTTVMGWSYGGFLTSLLATKYAGSFTNYVAIAPVTNWRNYGAAYTERIIGMPSDDPELYKALMPEEYVDNYKGGLLLIHGTADDNVYVQNSLKLAKTLTDADDNYDIQIFTDKGHDLSDGNTDKTRMNLYRKILKFLDRSKCDNK